jgi:hypothetical protein
LISKNLSSLFVLVVTTTTQVIDNEIQADKADPTCPAGVAKILERASSVLHPEILDAPPPPL